MQPEKLNGATEHPRQELIDFLQSNCPEIFTEGRIDPDRLKATLGEAVNDQNERYELNWAGKADCFRHLQEPITATLRPCREESVNFDETENLFIEGENLQVLKILQKSYFGKIKMIYIDPPYNTGNDSFIYPDRFQESQEEYLQRIGDKDEEGKLTQDGMFRKNSRDNGHYHSNWLSMMYPRLFLARNLLREDGVIFVSIDDNELSSLRLILDEVFGGENFVATISWRNVTDNNPTLINKDNEFIVVFAKNKQSLPQFWRSSVSEAKDLLLAEYHKVRDELGNDLEAIEKRVREFIRDNSEALANLTRYKLVDREGIYTGSESVHNPRAGGYQFDVEHPITKKKMRSPANGYRFPEPTFRTMERQGLILYGEDEKRIVKIKKYLKDFEDTFRSVITLDGRLGSYDVKRLFSTSSNLFNNPKPIELLKMIISFVSGENDIILDFFAGSCSTAHAVFELNRLDQKQRKSISIQLREDTDENSEAFQAGYQSIAEIGKKRIRLAGQQVLAEAKGSNLDIGFKVLKLSESNFKEWKVSANSGENLKPDTKPENLLYELILKSGLDLNVPVQAHRHDKKEFFRLDGGKLVICLEPALPESFLDHILTLSPQKFLCLDGAFAGDDQLKTNTALQMKERGIEFKVV